MTGALLLAAFLVFLPSGASGQSSAGQGVSPARLSLLEVPYLSQSEALCGGAAAAMVLRYWGARGVAAEDFAPLVDRAKGGIEASVLVRAIQERGYQALAATGTAGIVRRELGEGRPVMALIEDRPGAFHYVVIVGWHERTVVLHDPARTPYVLMNPREFERRWQASRNWMLSVTPPSGSESPFRVPVQSPSSESGLGVLARSACEALVADGVRLAQRNDLAGAERLLAGAAYQCTGAVPLRELAGVRLLQRRWPEVRELAGRAVELDPSDAHAWRLLASARYVGGDQPGALNAWNRAGVPRVDLVNVNGLRRTSHRAVERLIDIETGTVLTPTETERAHRRLEELPAAAMTRLEYVPRGSGTVEVRAHVLERTLLPEGRLTWAAIGLRAAASREITVPVSSLGRGGERLDASWRFWPNRPAAGIALHTPTSLGLLSLDMSAERQPFDVPIREAERLTTRVRAADWVTPFFRWEARAGFARWRHAGSYGTAGAAARVEGGGARAGAEVDAWFGDHRFATATLHAGWRSSAVRHGFVVDLSAAGEMVAARAPLDLWPAGDTGHARRSLLRAHPVLDSGRLQVARLGRHLAQGTAEAQHWWRAAAVPIGGALFVDLARTSARPAEASDRRAVTDVDVGAGFRLALPGRHGLFRADLARGLRDGRTVLSIGWAAE